MKVKYIIFLSIILIYGKLLPAHPLHLTVTNISYYKDQNRFELSVKIFKDDFITSFQNYFNINLTIDQYNLIDSLSYIYISDKLQIKKNKTALKLKKVKYELTSDSIWLFYQIETKKKIKKIVIFNNLLNELYNDMTNLVIFSDFNSEKGIKFDSVVLEHEIDIQ